MPSPLTPELADEANRVIDAFTEFYPARATWVEVKVARRRELAFKKMREVGLGQSVDRLVAFFEKQQGRMPPDASQIPFRIKTDLIELEPRLVAADKEIKSFPLDFDLRTTAELEQMIDDYRRWVAEQYAAEYPDRRPKQAKEARPAKPPL